jgi:8-oxo-dGTP diphosphatase
MSREHRHFGVYGVCRRGEHVLLIRKARGPYTGLLDLPGGGIGFGEEPETALRREFVEEAGLTIGNATLLQAASKVVRYMADDGREKVLHHIGLIYAVSLFDHSGENLPDVKSVADGEDSNGAVWVRYTDLDADAITPFAALLLL